MNVPNWNVGKQPGSRNHLEFVIGNDTIGVFQSKFNRKWRIGFNGGVAGAMSGPAPLPGLPTGSFNTLDEAVKALNDWYVNRNMTLPEWTPLGLPHATPNLTEFVTDIGTVGVYRRLFHGYSLTLDGKTAPVERHGLPDKIFTSVEDAVKAANDWYAERQSIDGLRYEWDRRHDDLFECETGNLAVFTNVMNSGWEWYRTGITDGKTYATALDAQRAAEAWYDAVKAAQTEQKLGTIKTAEGATYYDQLNAPLRYEWEKLESGSVHVCRVGKLSVCRSKIVKEAWSAYCDGTAIGTVRYSSAIGAQRAAEAWYDAQPRETPAPAVDDVAKLSARLTALEALFKLSLPVRTEQYGRVDADIVRDMNGPQPATTMFNAYGAAMREFKALLQAQQLAKTLHSLHYADNTEWRVADDLTGILSQIDNMTAGLKPTPTAHAGDLAEQLLTSILAQGFENDESADKVLASQHGYVARFLRKHGAGR